MDAAHGYHDLNFIAKEVRGIPELKEKEKITGWLAKISTHLDHLNLKGLSARRLSLASPYPRAARDSGLQ